MNKYPKHDALPSPVPYYTGQFMLIGSRYHKLWKTGYELGSIGIPYPAAHEGSFKEGNQVAIKKYELKQFILGDSHG